MAINLHANCLSLLIGSFPAKDHETAKALICKYSPDIPVWAQLPAFPQESMVWQFIQGLPGLKGNADAFFVDRDCKEYDKEVLAFYEEYMAVQEGKVEASFSRFALTADTTRGFFALLDGLKKLHDPPTAVKGQITGPFTFTTGIKDSEGRSIFYDLQIRDVAIKLLAMKAAWQVRQLSAFGCPVIIFIDEPALAGYGSSEFISISREEIAVSLEEVIAAIHGEGGLAGIHVCANTDWSVILGSSADIVNFDAYSYFDKIMLYSDALKDFLESGRILAWGIVPTFHPEHIQMETAASLAVRWEKHAQAVADLGLDTAQIKSRSLITPSCGTGSLNIELTEKVLKLTQDVSGMLRDTL